MLLQSIASSHAGFGRKRKVTDEDDVQVGECGGDAMLTDAGEGDAHRSLRAQLRTVRRHGGWRASSEQPEQAAEQPLAQGQGQDWFLTAVAAIAASTASDATSTSHLLNSLAAPVLLHWRAAFARTFATTLSLVFARAGVDEHAVRNLSHELNASRSICSGRAAFTVFRFVHQLEDSPSLLDLWACGVQQVSGPALTASSMGAEERAAVEKAFHMILVEFLMRYLAMVDGGAPNP
ncbi:hypothetical protein BC830DRAFT_1078637 [Chytriomyces sp. MP71]|nr:hypothetical protein BC830DRAFT_1078637 [Chytriomyces sp. MP71]